MEDDLFDRMENNNAMQLEAQKKAEAAAKVKASEYAALSAQVSELATLVNNLNNILQDLNPQSIEQVTYTFKEESNSIVERLKNSTMDIQKDIEQTGIIAKKNISRVANTRINWAQSIITAVFIAVFFSGIQFAIQYHFAPTVDYAKRIMWNINYTGDNGENYIRFFDNEEDAQRKYDNQKRYEDMEKFKAKQAQQQK